MKALFIHRSVGRNLIVEGGLRGLLGERGVELDDYDNNSDILTTSGGEEVSGVIAMPGNNTNPANLAEYFKSRDERLDEYEVIVIKSCYPNCRIKDEAQLESIRQSYLSIFDAFKSQRKSLILLTSPPLRPMFTNVRECGYVRQLNDWLMGCSGQHVKVLDFHALLSEENGRQKGMLRKEYRRYMPYDNHPNRKANQKLAPAVADFIAS